MKKLDKIKAIQQALRGNVKPLMATDENVIVGVIVAHKGIYEIVDLHPSIKASQSKSLNDLKGSIPLLT